MEAVELGRLADVLGVSVPAEQRAWRLTGVSTDTRTLRVGDVFFALSGERFDGASLVAQAFARGARAVVGPAHSPECGPTRALLRVADTREALLRFAADYRQGLRARVVAITGSAGKTTTKELLASMLAGSLSVVRAPKSFNNEVGVPLTLLQADRATDVVVLEIGTSGPGEIARLAAVAQPDVSLVTLIAPAHLAGLGSVEGVAREKLSLAEAARAAVILNGDDPRLDAWSRAHPGITRCGFGPHNELRGELGIGARPQLTVSGRLDARLTLPLPGRGPALDALLALAACDALGVSPADAALGLRGFRGPQGRLHTVECPRHTLLDDSYNANPASMRASLGTLCE
ncbi:MAG: UDP-N-acetylmuramoyl-tripeptide--D-alanyl-D-alanine ligase, partial [Planctomycetes bacterium]|nr:UDP-N-acetylmuramoyl-tripeptide--D-alanyl-D-alanine ligase [Planctomycetota bacterium]